MICFWYSLDRVLILEGFIKLINFDYLKTNLRITLDESCFNLKTKDKDNIVFIYYKERMEGKHAYKESFVSEDAWCELFDKSRIYFFFKYYFEYIYTCV